MKRPRHPFDEHDIAAVQAALETRYSHSNHGVGAVGILDALMRDRYRRDAARGIPDYIETTPAGRQSIVSRVSAVAMFALIVALPISTQAGAPLLVLLALAGGVGLTLAVTLLTCARSGRLATVSPKE